MKRYELLVDGEQAGYIDYEHRNGDAGDEVVLVHTELDPATKGSGLGTELVRGALNLVRAETDARVVAQCGFVARFIDGNAEYQDLLDR